jgi:type III secretion system FlhB-like substrate exporter
MMFTERALAAHIITQAEADEVESWIDEQVKTNKVANVPDHLYEIWNRVYTYIYTQGGMQ